jgi:hypothetical protein
MRGFFVAEPRLRARSSYQFRTNFVPICSGERPGGPEALGPAGGRATLDSVLRVYLDMNKWIEITRAMKAGPGNAPEVITLILAAVDRGFASFPLSVGHVFETWKAASARRRHDLAPAMAAISKHHAIAAPSKLLPGELDLALQRRFGRPAVARPVQPFGWGLQHSFGQPLPQVSAETRVALLAHDPTMTERDITAFIELALLAGPPQDLPLPGIAQPPLQFAEAFAADENAQMKMFAQHGADKDMRRRAVSARHMIDIKDELSVAQVRANVTNDDIAALGVDGVTELLLDLPSRGPGHHMMWWQHDNPQTKWEPNDLDDISYLSVAVGYCDVVVTERKWAHILNTSGAAERYGTIAISKLDDLTEVLVTASVAA